MSQNTLLTVRAAALTGLGALCRSYGVSAAGVLRAAGLPATLEDEPDRRVPVAAVNLALELAAEACGCDDFGLRLSELRGLANLGPIGLIARDEPTIGAALAAIEACLPLHNDALAVHREPLGDLVALHTAVLMPGAKRQAGDIALAMQHRILRQLAGAHWQAEEVLLTRPAPADPARFRQALGPRLRFEAESDAIIVRAELLARPNPLADPAFRPYASWLRVGADPGRGEPMAERVRRVLWLLLPGGRCTAAHVADRLGVSRRTLTRALEAEGTRFLALLDETRRDIAQRQLGSGTRSLAEISDILGFSGAAAFSTWFRHHHGTSPRRWRAAQRISQRVP
jgi:AraC-like DNA-binding protein